MTQSQLAGGTVDPPQARPVKGQLIRDSTLISALGQPISLSDYRGRSNLVLVLAGGSADSPDLGILNEIASNYAQFREEQAEVLAILQCDRERATRIARQTGLPFPLLVDEDGQIHRSAGAEDRLQSSGSSNLCYRCLRRSVRCVPAGRKTNNAGRAGDCEMAELHQYAVSGVRASRVAALSLHRRLLSNLPSAGTYIP